MITLGIIGVVAAITMPTLINKINRAHWNSLLKADYSILAQAHQYLTNEDDGIVGKLSNCSGTSQQKNDCFRDVIMSKIKKAYECDAGSNEAGRCFPPKSEVKMLNGTSDTRGYVSVTASSSIVIANGSAMIFWLDSPTCEQQTQGRKDVCGWVTVDVNGGKGPNVMGEDIYVFYIYKSFVRPYTAGNRIDPCDKNSTIEVSAVGLDCSHYYLTK